MKFKILLLVIFTSLFLYSCAEDNDVVVPRNLQDYIASISNNDMGEVIACAANANGNTSLSYIFYYPEEGATDIRYYEADSLEVDQTDFSKYRRKELSIQDVFGGKLQRFYRSSSIENWCLVTYMLNGKLHKSNPIKLKNESKSTLWKDEVTIEYPTTLAPKFTWSDFGVTDNDIYFQAITETDEDVFVSGTYTQNKTFQYQNNSNVVLDINTETPSDLKIDAEYTFTMMGVSEDNWVNLVIEENFVPRNLENYLNNSELNTTDTIKTFAASANGNENLSYIYFYPLTNAREFRFYETDGINNVDETDLSNYRRKIITDEAVFGAKFRRFSRTDDEESWYVVTYEIDEVVYRSTPVRLRNKTRATIWEDELTIDATQTLKPHFTWSDFGATDNSNYLHILTDKEDVFVSGIYTEEHSFLYYDISNTTSNINTNTPSDLILDDTYNCTLLALSTDNWVNLIIQKSFIVQ